MSMAEPLLPAHTTDDSAAEQAIDVPKDAGIDPEARTAEPETTDAPEDANAGPFRSPAPGDRLTAAELAAELDEDTRTD